jgi:hypothetical protein
MSKENERGRHPHPVIFCPMTLQHLFLTSKFPLGYGSLDPDGTWDMGSCLTEKESKAHRESRRGEMNLTVGMIWDSGPRSSTAGGYGATPLLSLNLRLILTNISALREHNLSSQVTMAVCGFLSMDVPPRPLGPCRGGSNENSLPYVTAVFCSMPRILTIVLRRCCVLVVSCLLMQL